MMAVESTDILLIEDIGETVEGLEIDLRSRGASVFRLPDRERAARSLRDDTWSLILFDLRIPEIEGAEERLDVGVELIKATLEGMFGDRNVRTPFAIVSQQAGVSEAASFGNYANFIGFFSKSEDPRRLFRTLRMRGLLKDSELEEETTRPEVRRRTKFLLHSLTADHAYVIATAPTWGDEKFEIALSDLMPGLRERVQSGHLPVFVFGTANVAAASSFELEPADFESAMDLVEPLHLSEPPSE